MFFGAVGPSAAGLWDDGNANEAKFGETALIDIAVQDVPNYVDFQDCKLKRLEMVTVRCRSTRHPDMEKMAIFWCRDGEPISIWREKEFSLPEGISADMYIISLPNSEQSAKAASAVATRIYLELSLRRVIFHSIWVQDKDFYAMQNGMQCQNFFSQQTAQGRQLDSCLTLFLSDVSVAHSEFLAFSPGS